VALISRRLQGVHEYARQAGRRNYMAIHADDLVKVDLLDRYVHARMRLRAVSSFADNPNLRTCARCGERVVMGRDMSGWSLCPACGRYA
jgi:anaerobic ribonucleoside-triphosphate reductase